MPRMHAPTAVARSLALAAATSAVALPTLVAHAQEAVQWRVEDGGNGHWYRYVDRTTTDITWSETRAEAMSMGGDLVTLETIEEWDFFCQVTNCGPEGVSSGPIGLVRSESDPNQWSWVSGVNLTYDRWRHPDEPNPNPSENRGIIIPAWDQSPYNAFATNSQQLLQEDYFVEWSADCNGDGIVDYGQILDGTFVDADGNGVPDGCEQDLWLWGRNEYGECEPPQDLLPLVKVAGTGSHVVVLQVDGTVAAWGRNNFGQIDVPGFDAPCVDVAGGDQHSIALDVDGRVHCWGDNRQGQCDVPIDLPPAIAVATGSNHSLALLEDGTVRAWGYSPFGAIDVPAGLQNVVKVDGGAHHSAALLADGTIVAWGGNDGESNVPSGLAPFVDLKVSQYNSIALNVDGGVGAWGRNMFGQTNVPAKLAPVELIGIGAHSALVRTVDGEIVCWGNTSWNECDVPEDVIFADRLGASNLHGVAWVASDLEIDDCNGDGIVDYGQIVDGTYADDDGNGVIDCCDDGTCLPPVQWRVEDGGNGHWYQYSSEFYSWNDALNEAVSQGGTLVCTELEEEHVWVSGMLPSMNSRCFNLGLFQDFDSPDFVEPDGGWYWLSGEPLTFERWNELEPNNSSPPGGEHVAMAFSDPLLWNDFTGGIDAECGLVIEWSADCNEDGIVDYGQILDGTYPDEDGNGVPDCCDAGEPCDGCPGDITGNGIVDAADLGILLAVWNTDGKSNPEADINGDGVVNAADLGLLLGAWGICGP